MLLRRFVARSAVTLAGCSALEGCTTDDGGTLGVDSGGADAATVLCIPGESIACAGEGACGGFQVCQPGGQSYAPCMCEGADAGGDDGILNDAADGSDAGVESGSQGDSGGDAGAGADTGSSGDGGSIADAGADSGVDAGDGMDSGSEMGDAADGGVDLDSSVDATMEASMGGDGGGTADAAADSSIMDSIGGGDSSNGDDSGACTVGCGLPFVSLSASGIETCGVRTDGSLWCWGYLGEPTDDMTAFQGTPAPTRIGSDSDWATVSVGETSCAVKTNGTLWCWGADFVDPVPDGGTYPAQWWSSPVQIGTGSNWQSVSTSGCDCGIQTDHTLWCWGGNSSYNESGGCLGDSTLNISPTPTQVGSSSDWVSVSTGFATCALDSGGSLYCWGDDTYGELGALPPVQRLVPTLVDPAGAWASVSTTSQHTCGTQKDGSLWCWGTDDNGDLGNGGTSSTSPSRVGAGTSWASVGAGPFATCATQSDGSLWCWGDNTYGGLGIGTTQDVSTPTRVGTATDWATVEVADYYACATRRDGSVWCWGSNEMTGGAIGLGVLAPKSQPVQAGTASNWVSLSSAYNTTCGTESDGSAWCWGDTINTITSEADFIAAPTYAGSGWRALSAGSYSMLGITTAGALDYIRGSTSFPGASWTWIAQGGTSFCGVEAGNLMCGGSNAAYQFGNGTTTPGTSVVEQPPYTTNDWAQVALTNQSVCATQVNGTLWCWGSGYVGDPGYSQRMYVEQTGTATDWASIRGASEGPGDNSWCGLKTGGTLWCWGVNTDGQLGDGTTETSFVPEQIGIDVTWASVSPAVDHTCGTKTDGTLWCWGSNSTGQLGDGTLTARLVPTRIGADTNWAQVSTQANGTCAIKSDGTLWCWGDNRWGQVGDDTAFRTAPFQVP